MMKIIIKQKKEDTVCIVLSSVRGYCVLDFAESIALRFQKCYRYDKEYQMITFYYMNTDTVVDYIKSHFDEIEVVNK